jgi:hypothetical protein
MTAYWAARRVGGPLLRGNVALLASGNSLQDIEAELARRQPLLVAAAAEVDTTLIDWALSLTPLERLRACSRAARALARWRHVPSNDR